MRGLDDPFTVQYVRWIEQIPNGGFSEYLISPRPIWPDLKRVMGNTLQLVVIAEMFAFVTAVALGAVACFCLSMRPSSCRLRRRPSPTRRSAPGGPPPGYPAHRIRARVRSGRVRPEARGGPQEPGSSSFTRASTRRRISSRIGRTAATPRGASTSACSPS